MNPPLSGVAGKAEQKVRDVAPWLEKLESQGDSFSEFWIWASIRCCRSFDLPEPDLPTISP